MLLGQPTHIDSNHMIVIDILSALLNLYNQDLPAFNPNLQNLITTTKHHNYAPQPNHLYTCTNPKPTTTNNRPRPT